MGLFRRLSDIVVANLNALLDKAENPERMLAQNEREDLARRAIARHLEQVDLAQVLHAQHSAAQQASAEVQAALRTLEARLEQARRSLRLLRARQRGQDVQAQARAAGGFVTDPRSPFARFARLEPRLAELHDDLLVHAALTGPPLNADAELCRLETDERVGRALAALTVQTFGQ
jgi:phage shock protein A